MKNNLPLISKNTESTDPQFSLGSFSNPKIWALDMGFFDPAWVSYLEAECEEEKINESILNDINTTVQLVIQYSNNDNDIINDINIDNNLNVVVDSARSNKPNNNNNNNNNNQKLSPSQHPSPSIENNENDSFYISDSTQYTPKSLYKEPYVTYVFGNFEMQKNKKQNCERTNSTDSSSSRYTNQTSSSSVNNSYSNNNSYNNLNNISNISNNSHHGKHSNNSNNLNNNSHNNLLPRVNSFLIPGLGPGSMQKQNSNEDLNMGNMGRKKSPERGLHRSNSNNNNNNSHSHINHSSSSSHPNNSHSNNNGHNNNHNSSNNNGNSRVSHGLNIDTSQPLPGRKGSFATRDSSSNLQNQGLGPGHGQSHSPTQGQGQGKNSVSNSDQGQGQGGGKSSGSNVDNTMSTDYYSLIMMSPDLTSEVPGGEFVHWVRTYNSFLVLFLLYFYFCFRQLSISLF